MPDALHRGVSLEELAHLEGVLHVRLHPQLQSLEAPVDQVAVEGGGDRARGKLEEADALVERVVPQGHAAHQHVAVPVHVLGDGVVGDVGT